MTEMNLVLLIVLSRRCGMVQQPVKIGQHVSVVLFFIASSRFLEIFRKDLISWTSSFDEVCVEVEAG